MHVIATFPDEASARLAIRDLEAAGFARAGMRLARNSRPDALHGAVVLSVDAGDQSDDARMLMRKNNATNLQDAGDTVSAAETSPAATPSGAAPTEREDGQPLAEFGGMTVVPPLMPVVTPPPSAMGGMNVVGVDLEPTIEASAEAQESEDSEDSEDSEGNIENDNTKGMGGLDQAVAAIPGIDPAASSDAAADDGELLPPLDDPDASTNANPETHPTPR